MISTMLMTKNDADECRTISNIMWYVLSDVDAVYAVVFHIGENKLSLVRPLTS